MTGRPESTRALVRAYMQQATEPVTVQQVCHALQMDVINDDAGVRRSLVCIGAIIVGTTKKTPIPNQRGGCKPAYLWSLHDPRTR